MSNAKRRRAHGEQMRQARRAGMRQGHDYDNGPQAIVVGWARTPADVEEVKRLTHDHLIETTGARRRGGVQWGILTGGDATDVLGHLTTGATEAEANQYRRIRARLREWGGYLVVAQCAAVPPPGTTLVQ